VGYRASYIFDNIITDHPYMKKIIDSARKAARADCNVLLMGESGTGKELFAQSIHNDSRRAKGSFVAVNCASIPKDLVESELFGYEKVHLQVPIKKDIPESLSWLTVGQYFWMK